MKTRIARFAAAAGLAVAAAGAVSRHALLIVAAVLTPTTDMVSQLLLAVPLIVLYEISIWIVRASEGKR